MLVYLWKKRLYLICMALFLFSVLITGCKHEKDDFYKDKTKDLLKIIESEKKKPRNLTVQKLPETPMRVTTHPDPQGWPQSAIHSRKNKNTSSPAVEVKVLNRWSRGNSYILLVAFENTTSRQGNMSINVYHFDKNDRMVNLSTQVWYFRPFQKYVRRYNFTKNSNEVRWVINVSE